MSMTEHFVLDRVEDDDVAVLETADERRLTIPASWLPRGVREGDVVEVEVERREGTKNAAGGAILTLMVDPDRTAARREEAHRLREALPRAADGDISI